MKKIATPVELQSELKSLLRYAKSPTPSRARVVGTLQALSSRLEPRTASGEPTRTKVAKTYNLETMASELVGDGKMPNWFFVTNQAGKVLAVVTTTKGEAARVASVLGGYLVEDRKHGEVWTSAAYDKAQQEADPDE